MIPDLTIVFDLDGVQRKLRYRDLAFHTWEEVKATLNFTPKTLLDALDEHDMTAIAAIVWLERKQRERKLSYAAARAVLIEGDHEFEIVDILQKGKSLMGGEGDEEEGADGAVDPTTGVGS